MAFTVLYVPHSLDSGGGWVSRTLLSEEGKLYKMSRTFNRIPRAEPGFDCLIFDTFVGLRVWG